VRQSTHCYLLLLMGPADSPGMRMPLFLGRWAFS